MVKDIQEQNFDAEVLSESEKKLVIVDFWAPWCGPCLMMAPILEELDKSMGSSVSIVKINVDENPEISSEFSIRSIPTLIVFKQGKPVATEIGLKRKADLESLINNYKF